MFVHLLLKEAIATLLMGLLFLWPVMELERARFSTLLTANMHAINEYIVYII